jgi:hypothetical protein
MWKIQWFLAWSHCNRWSTQMKKYKDFLKCSYYNEWPDQAEKLYDFSEWPHCNGRLTQVKNTKIFQSSLIVMDNLPKWKGQRFFKVVLL